MKRLVCFFMMLSLLLTGCSTMGTRVKDPVTFYYVRRDYREDMGSVVASEIREASGHRYDLPYLLAMYSMGPSDDEDLVSPLPGNVTILPVEHSDGNLTLSLPESTEDMTEAEFTLAAVCLALTCMDLIQVEQVTLVCDGRSITINEKNLLLDSNYIQTAPEESK